MVVYLQLSPFPPVPGTIYDSSFVSPAVVVEDMTSRNSIIKCESRKEKLRGEGGGVDICDGKV